MIPLHSKLRAQIFFSIEILLTISSFFICYQNFGVFIELLSSFGVTARPLENYQHYAQLFILIFPLWILALYFGQTSSARFSKAKIIWNYFKVTALVTGMTFAILFAFKMFAISRLFIGINFLTFLFLVLSARFAFSKIWPGIFLSKDKVSILLVGDYASVSKFLKSIDIKQYWGTEWCRIVLTDKLGNRESLIKDLNNFSPELEFEASKICSLDSFYEKTILRDIVCDEAIILTNSSDLNQYTKLLKMLQQYGVNYHLHLSDLFGDNIEKVRLGFYSLGNIGLMSKSATPEIDYKIVFKRLFDYSIALVIFFAGLPLWGLIALAIYIEDSGTVFYRQKRVGKNGRNFFMWKFRTMVKDADKIRENLESQNKANRFIFKIQKDPRVTGVGRFLRRFSLDEVPQILNVLKGDMSMVGPRPAMINEVDSYTEKQMRRLSVKPGITGLWQVSGRADLCETKWLELDLRYIDEWSLVLDLKIVLKTFYAVLSGKGAY